MMRSTAATATPGRTRINAAPCGARERGVSPPPVHPARGCGAATAQFLTGPETRVSTSSRPGHALVDPYTRRPRVFLPRQGSVDRAPSPHHTH